MSLTAKYIYVYTLEGSNQVYICVYEHKYMQIDIYIYDRFH